LLVHPADAARYGLTDGGPAKVSSEAGSLVVTAEVTDAIKPGVVSLPHGWGHDKPGTRLSVANEHAGVHTNGVACSLRRGWRHDNPGPRLSVANEHAGVNTNVLSPGEFVDVLSGN